MKKFILSILTILTVIYIGGFFYFKEYSYPNTTIDGNNVGLRRISSFYFEDHGEEPFTLILNDNKEEISLPYKRYIAKDKTFSHPIIWPYEIFQNNDYKSDIEYDKSKLENKFDELNSKKVKNSELIVKDDKVKITDEIYGYNIPKNINLDLNNKEIDLNQYVLSPKIKKNDLIDKKNKIDKILSSSLSLLDHTVTGQDYYDLVDENLNLDYDKVYSFVENVADETDTLKKVRKFNSHSGEIVDVQPGVYGWTINKDKTTKKILEQKTGNIEPSYKTYARSRDFSDDIGNTYLEIDKNDQKLYAYKDGDLIFSTNIVTGYTGKADTPEGMFYIWDKRENATLKAKSRITGLKYETPVSYWMPIDWTGVGLHDATWRNSFGGDIYTYNGSNGCINLPLEVAKNIFDNFEIGTPVVIY